jgi:hypothetical protein
MMFPIIDVRFAKSGSVSESDGMSKAASPISSKLCFSVFRERSKRRHKYVPQNGRSLREEWCVATVSGEIIVLWGSEPRLNNIPQR